ncbi:hypothetical protein [Hymenobacter sp.]
MRLIVRAACLTIVQRQDVKMRLYRNGYTVHETAIALAPLLSH